jgi:3-deoxy-7-phosphoheptulonate synthase
MTYRPYANACRSSGYKVHSIEGEERVVIGIVGVGDVTACLESIEAMPGVEKAVRISAPISS